MGTILYGNMQWWTMAEFDVTSNFFKEIKMYCQIAKVHVCGNAREKIKFFGENHIYHYWGKPERAPHWSQNLVCLRTSSVIIFLLY